MEDQFTSNVTPFNYHPECEKTRIDYIWVSEKIEVMNASAELRALPKSSGGEEWFADHVGVIATLRVGEGKGGCEIVRELESELFEETRKALQGGIDMSSALWSSYVAAGLLATFLSIFLTCGVCFQQRIRSCARHSILLERALTATNRRYRELELDSFDTGSAGRADAGPKGVGMMSKHKRRVSGQDQVASDPVSVVVGDTILHEHYSEGQYVVAQGTPSRSPSTGKERYTFGNQYLDSWLEYFFASEVMWGYVMALSWVFGFVSGVLLFGLALMFCTDRITAFRYALYRFESQYAPF